MAYGEYGAVARRAPAHAESREVDLGRVAVLPGLVNAHTHLELSYLRDEVPAAPDFPTWIRRVMAARRQHPSPTSPEILDGVAQAIEESAAFGTAVVGDISNTLVSFGPLARSSLAGVVFFELLGFNAANPVDLVAQARRELALLEPADRVRTSLAAHAPHTVAPARSSGDPPVARGRSVCAVQRAPCGIGRGSGVHPDRGRTLAQAPRGSRGVECGLVRARRQPGAVSR